MTDYIAAYGNPQNPYHREARRLAERLTDIATATLTRHSGVIRWVSNGRVPPADVVALAEHIGIPVNIAACDAGREADLQDFLVEYRRGQANLSAEARAEMRYERAANRY